MENEIEILDNSVALAAINRSEIDVQIATAKHYPRSVKKFHSRALELSTLDEDTAASCFYKMPRSGKVIEGPSVRLAEIVCHAWGNVRAASRIIEVGEKAVVAQATVLDLEANTAVSVEVRRRITNKQGDRFNDDMINVTCNAAASIAFREGVFKVVPRSLWKGVYESVKKVAVGDAHSLASRRDAALGWFIKAGATKEQILAKLGRAGEADITLDDLELLTGIRTAIKDGELAIEAAFAVEAEIATAQAAPSAEGLNAKLAAKKAERAKLKELEPDPELLRKFEGEKPL